LGEDKMRVPEVKEIECDYPHCKNKAEYSPSKNTHLCQEHYDLHRFIQQTIFVMPISINPFADRFEDMDKLYKKEASE
jgi:hypothetical protein